MPIDATLARPGGLSYLEIALTFFEFNENGSAGRDATARLDLALGTGSTK